MSNVLHKFKYVKIGNYFRPLIGVTLRNGSQSMNYIALVDSGADFNLFHTDIASLLGIDLSNIKQIDLYGVNDKKPLRGYPAGVEIGINGSFYSSMVVFSPDIVANSLALMGQAGFFDRFVVQFDYKKRLGYLKK